MKNLKSRKLGDKVGKIVVSFALIVTTLSVNTACVYIAHQSKLPESAKKFRKF